MRCPACTQRNSVAARACQFCGQKFKKKPLGLPIKIGACAVGVGVVAALASTVIGALGPALNASDKNLKDVALRMAAGPKNPDEAQLMKVQLDGVLEKYLQANSDLKTNDLLTKLQSELPTSTFEVAVFDLPKDIRLVEVDCVLQSSDYLIAPGSKGKKVTRIPGIGVFDQARFVPAENGETCLVLLGHTSGEGPREPQMRAFSVAPTGEISDKSATILPRVKGCGTASFIGTTCDIKIDRALVSSAKEQGLFEGAVPFNDESSPVTLTLKNGKYVAKGSLGNGEFAALYAVASALVQPDEAIAYRQYISADAQKDLSALAKQPIASPGAFKLCKNSAAPGRRKRRKDGDGSASYILVSKNRAYSVDLTRQGRWYATSLKETNVPEGLNQVASNSTSTTNQAGATNQSTSVSGVSAEQAVTSNQTANQLAPNQGAPITIDAGSVVAKTPGIIQPAHSSQPAIIEVTSPQTAPGKGVGAENRRMNSDPVAKIIERTSKKFQQTATSAASEGSAEHPKTRAEIRREQREKRRLAREEQRKQREAEEAARTKKEEESRVAKREDNARGTKGAVAESARGVTMRSGPGRRYGSVMNISRGVPVRILAEDDVWVKISAKGKEGWVYKSYLNRGKVACAPSKERSAESRERHPDRKRHIASKAEDTSEHSDIRSEKKVHIASKPEKTVEKKTSSDKNESKGKSSKRHGSPNKPGHADSVEEPNFVP